MGPEARLMLPALPQEMVNEGKTAGCRQQLQHPLRAWVYSTTGSAALLVGAAFRSRRNSESNAAIISNSIRLLFSSFCDGASFRGRSYSAMHFTVLYITHLLRILSISVVEIYSSLGGLYNELREFYLDLIRGDPISRSVRRQRDESSSTEPE